MPEFPGYSVICDAHDGSQLIELARQLRPDIILLDISMKDTNGLDSLEQLLIELPLSKVLILSIHTDPQMIMRALE
ncbi:response regulator transcription factor, partial [Pseudomonas sp. AH2 (2023)]|uniref:response regulator n=1 Tax=Pseudomonas sp. AH2 (2023) TaxID=3048599 RepID=UPI002B22F90A